MGSLNLSHQVELWVVIPIVVVSVLVGFLLAAPTSDRYYKAERNALRERLEQLEHLRAYTESFRLTVNAFRSGNVSVAPLPEDPGDRLQALLCRLPSQLIEGTTGRSVGLSVWLEKPDFGVNRRFEVVFSANHTKEEISQFDSIAVEDSWLYRSAQPRGFTPAEDSPLASDGSPLAGISALANYEGVGSPDIKVFRDLGYQSVRAVSVEIKGKTIRLVALSRERAGFGALEDVYLLFLWCALTVAAYHITTSTNWRQVYGTSVEVTGLSAGESIATFGTVPSRSIPQQLHTRITGISGLAEIVGATASDATLLNTASARTAAVAVMLDATLDGPTVTRMLTDIAAASERNDNLSEYFRRPEDELKRAQTLLAEIAIPIEASPVSGKSIESIISGSGGSALVVAVATGSVTPWLLIAVPAGVVIMKIAHGIGDGAGEAAHDIVKSRLLDWLSKESSGRKEEDSQ